MIDKFKFRCTKVLPLVFDEALSYYEVLCKLTEKINGCIDKINDLTDMVTETNEQISTLTNEINTIKHTKILDLNIDLASASYISLPEIPNFDPTSDVFVAVRSRISENQEVIETKPIITSVDFTTSWTSDVVVQTDMYGYLEGSRRVYIQLTSTLEESKWHTTGFSMLHT